MRARLRTVRDRQLHRAEVRRGRRHEARADRTPIFILGAPRSGTTLLYQLLVEGLEVGWLANAHASRASDVARVERRTRPRAGRGSSDWDSDHGATGQPWGPSEAGEFWYRFVPRRPHQLQAADVTPARVAAVRAAVREFADACESPVVFKNVFNSLRIPLLARALPEARYVLIERDLEANARSLLAGRARHGGVHEWWSAEPAGSDAVRTQSPAHQVAWQVQAMNEVARAELDRLEPASSLIVSYEELCTRPREVLERIHAWLEASGVQVRRRADARMPASFELRGGGVLDPAVEQDLHAVLSSGPAGEDAT